MLVIRKDNLEAEFFIFEGEIKKKVIRNFLLKLKDIFHHTDLGSPEKSRLYRFISLTTDWARSVDGCPLSSVDDDELLV